MALLLPKTRGRRGGDRLHSARAQTSTLKQPVLFKPLLFKPLLLNPSWFNRAARGIRTFVTLAAMGLGENVRENAQKNAKGFSSSWRRFNEKNSGLRLWQEGGRVCLCCCGKGACSPPPLFGTIFGLYFCRCPTRPPSWELRSSWAQGPGSAPALFPPEENSLAELVTKTKQNPRLGPKISDFVPFVPLKTQGIHPLAGCFLSHIPTASRNRVPVMVTLLLSPFWLQMPPGAG